jgi:niacin transporter
MLIFMMVELPVMRLIAGGLFRKLQFNIAFSLIGAMLSGRVVLGLAIMTMSGLLGFSLPPVWTYLSGSLITGLPGVALQVILIPVLLMATERGTRRWSATSR